ncbi:PQQ-binding-like beta-propeller repeat protein, partial [Tahibacter aquaticus]|uniref:outer membrane protein assembly factor BamB family protein n=1 Tax=Tahibacter aquaticus TaxID=520092 RepID=UPI00105E65DF
KHCNLLRYSSQGVRELSLAVPPANGGAGDCLELAVAADGSLIVLRERALLRLASDGSLLWQNATVNARSTDGPSLLIDAQQRIVIANNSASDDASVARYDMDGVFLDDAYVPNTGRNTALSLDLLPNDDVIVSGKMDLPGDFSQTGFVSRWSSTGTLQLLNVAYTDTPYLRSVHDAAGNLFVLTGQNTVRAIDPLSGQLRWEQAASAMAARPDGVLLTDGNSTVTAVDAAGIAAWTHMLSAQDIRFASGSSDPNLTPRLLLQSGDSTPVCGRGPEVLSFTTTGAVAQRQKVCATAINDDVMQMQAAAGGGIGLLTRYRVRALDDSGTAQWEFDNCNFSCTGQEPARPLASRVLADGGSWLLNEQRGAPRSRTLLRLAANGSTLQSFNVPLPSNGLFAAALVADADEAVVLQANGKDLRWVRFTRSGGLREIRDYALPGTAAGSQRQWFATTPRRLPGGDIVLAYARGGPCPWNLCPLPDSMLLRLTADGSLRWQYELAQVSPFAGFNDDGSAIALDLYATAAQTRIVVIDAQGVATTQLPGFLIEQATGPSRGNYLLRANGVHYRMNASGVLTATDIAYPPAGNSAVYLAVSEAGFLLDASSQGIDAVLIDPLSLAAYASFDIDGATTASVRSSAYKWTMADDGSIYAAAFLPADGAAESPLRSSLVRFAVPGWSADDPIYADSFE